MIWWSSWASKPLQYINSPYLLMIAAYFVACLMSLAVSSATGLGVLLMATLFPVMVNVGISRGAAAAILCLPGGDYSRTDFRGCVLAAQASEMSLIDFAFKTTLLSQLLQLSAWRSPTSSGNVIWIKKSTSLMKC
ncbi:C4-dicarboxylate transporter DcuC [Escherichia coli]|uniref:C4-dicarboxylate transporter DcuC n=1 Tax=Escherichia coli TaxID=562 RepID=A0A376VQ38_ECOLX|nr:C4-dicarboxylate transporter DcuC [Escherichia coli]